MSRHYFPTVTKPDGAEVVVVIGYDRPLNNIYCYVEPDGGCDDSDMLYSSIFDDDRTMAQAVEDFTAPLLALGIVLPEPVLENVRADQLARAGDREVFYTADGTIEKDSHA